MPRRARGAPILLVLVVCLGLGLGLSGCGGSSTSPPTASTATPAAPTSATGTAVTSANPGGPRVSTSGTPAATAARAFARLPARTILADAVRALSGVSAFQVQGTIDQAGQAIAAVIVYQAPARLAASIRRGAGEARIVGIPPNAYLYANAAFGASNFSDLSASERAQLENRWLELTGSTGVHLTASFTTFTPRRISACLASSFPAPAVAETERVDGRLAVVLRYASATQGAGTLVVSATTPHEPLIFERVRARRASADGDPCEQGTGGTGRLSFSRFDSATVTAPAHALVLR